MDCSLFKVKASQHDIVLHLRRFNRRYSFNDNSEEFDMFDSVYILLITVAIMFTLCCFMGKKGFASDNSENEVLIAVSRQESANNWLEHQSLFQKGLSCIIME